MASNINPEWYTTSEFDENHHIIRITLNLSRASSLLRNGWVATMRKVAARTAAEVTDVEGIITITGPDLCEFETQILAPGGIVQHLWYSWRKVHVGA